MTAPTEPNEVAPLPELPQPSTSILGGWKKVSASLAGFEVTEDNTTETHYYTAAQLRAFALAERQATIERCARIAESMRTWNKETQAYNEGRPTYDDDADKAIDDVVAAIRALK